MGWGLGVVGSRGGGQGIGSNGLRVVEGGRGDGVHGVGVVGWGLGVVGSRGWGVVVWGLGMVGSRGLGGWGCVGGLGLVGLRGYGV